MPIDCLDEGSACAKNGGCAQPKCGSDVRDAILNVLDNTTIADLAVRDRAREPAGARYIDLGVAMSPQKKIADRRHSTSSAERRMVRLSRIVPAGSAEIARQDGSR